MYFVLAIKPMDYKIRFSPNETDTDALMRSFLTQGYAVRRVASKDIFNVYRKMENRPRIELGGQAACFEPSDVILSTRAGGKEPMFIIEDEAHGEIQPGQFATFADAVAELRRLAAVPWNEAPNAAPCQSWRTCGRNYELVEYDGATTPWTELQRIPALNISAAGTKWLL